MTAINDRLNAVAEFGDVVPACVVSLCGDASTEIARLQAQVDALAGALRGLHTVCTLALSDKTGKQFSYFETRAGTFVYAVEAMQSAESALTAVGR